MAARAFVATIKDYVDLTRPRNASGSVLTFGIGYFLVAQTPHASFFVGLVILLALHALATAQNDVADLEVDTANHRGGALQEGRLTTRTVRHMAWGLGLLAVLVAALSTDRWLNSGAVALLVCLSAAYNLRPIQWSKHPLLSILLMGLCYGALPFAYGYLLAGGGAGPTLWLLAALCCLARIGTSIMKDYKDAAGDKRYHKRTFYVRFGPKATAIVSIAASFLAYTGLIVALVILGDKSSRVFLITLALLTLLAARSFAFRFRLLKTTDEQLLNVIFHRSVFRHNQFEGAMLLCLLLSFS